LWDDVLVRWCTCEMMCLWDDVLVRWCACEMMCLWDDVLVRWCACEMMYLWDDVLVRWCTCEMMCLWDDVLPTRQYSANALVVTTITIPVLILFSITGCRHAVPLYDGALYRDQSSVAYHRQWHLCVGVWTRVKLALTVLLLEQKCSGTWPKKPATGCILAHIRATCFLKIFFSIINHPFWKLG